MTASIPAKENTGHVTAATWRHAIDLAHPDQLPAHAQSKLRINVPLVVQLATKKETVGEIVKIVPGAILQFDQPCNEMLGLYVNNQQIATGEAVKVDDRYGLRIVEFTEPGERFRTNRDA